MSNWEKECLSKKRYSSSIIAEKIAKERSEATKEEITFYRCSSCEHWHLTKKKFHKGRYKYLRVV